MKGEQLQNKDVQKEYANRINEVLRLHELESNIDMNEGELESAWGN